MLSLFLVSQFCSIRRIGDTESVRDPFSILEEGEIHFTSSKNLQEPSLQCLDPKTIIGDVLVCTYSKTEPSRIIDSCSSCIEILHGYHQTSARCAAYTSWTTHCAQRLKQVKAVDCPALRRYTDVIVLPTKGTCSLASLLAGGGEHARVDNSFSTKPLFRCRRRWVST